MDGLDGIGRLPGDIRFDTGNVRIYLPIGTMLVVSLLLTIILNIVSRR